MRRAKPETIADAEKVNTSTAGKPVFGKVVIREEFMTATFGEGEGEGATCAISTCLTGFVGLVVLIDANLPVSKKYPTASADNTNPIVINLSHLGSSIWADFITLGSIKQGCLKTL